MDIDYIFIAAILFIPALAFTLHFWQHSIRPSFIPKAEIQKLATQLIKIHGENAYDFAHMHEDTAWQNSETYEQAKWKKIGKTIRNMQPDLYA